MPQVRTVDPLALEALSAIPQLIDVQKRMAIRYFNGAPFKTSTLVSEPKLEREL
jgi:hypothetical protein